MTAASPDRQPLARAGADLGRPNTTLGHLIARQVSERLRRARTAAAARPKAQQSVRTAPAPGSDTHAARLVALADDLSARIPQPLDRLELAAVIESDGVTDEVARADYQAETVFTLAEQVFPLVLERTIAARRPGAAHDPHARAREREGRRALVSGALSTLLALMPLVLLVAVTEILAHARWTSGKVLALSFGVTTAMLLTSGPLLAISRRTCMYRGFGYHAMASRYLRNGASALALVTSCASAAGFAAASLTGLATSAERQVFCIALAASGLLWIQATYLLLAEDAAWLAGTIGAAVAAGGGAELLISSPPTAVAVATGVALLLLLCGIARRARPKGDTIPFPRLSLLAAEGVPYAAYGFGVMIFLLGPHVLGWLGTTDGLSRLHALTGLELSLLFALVPLLLANTLLEPLLRGFWSHTRALQEGGDAAAFRLGVASFHRRRIAVYAAALAALVVLAATAFSVLVYVTSGGRSLSNLVFLLGLVGYCLLGYGQFSCLVMLSLGQPRLAARSIGCGIVVSYGVAAPLALVDFRYVAIGLACGAATFALASTYAWRSLIRRADHCYAAAF